MYFNSGNNMVAGSYLRAMVVTLTLDFPTSGLTVGQVYTGSNGIMYVWTGTLWLASGASAGGDFSAMDSRLS